jgi:hypothetical protein
MKLRILRATEYDHDYPTSVKEVPHAYLDGTMTGIDALEGQPIQISIINGKVDCDAVYVHATEYSRRNLNTTVTNMIKQLGPQSLDALSSTRDLTDTSCFMWDEVRPYELNPNRAPSIENGAPLAGQVQKDSDGSDDENDDDV